MNFWFLKLPQHFSVDLNWRYLFVRKMRFQHFHNRDPYTSLPRIWRKKGERTLNIIRDVAWNSFIFCARGVLAEQTYPGHRIDGQWLQVSVALRNCRNCSAVSLSDSFIGKLRYIYRFYCCQFIHHLRRREHKGRVINYRSVGLWHACN